MTDYRKYINALRKCAKEHENDDTLTGHIIVSDLCHDTANLLESLEQESMCNPASEKLLNVSVDDMLEKLETEIEQLTSRYTVSKERGGMGQVEWSDRLIKEDDILRITNSYRTESEDGKDASND